MKNIEPIEDLGMLYPTDKSKNKTRFWLIECEKCKNTFKKAMQEVKRGKTHLCEECRKSNSKRSKQDNDIKIIEDLGMLYPNKNSKVKYRFWILECSKCKNGYRQMAAEAKRSKYQICKNCLLEIKTNKDNYIINNNNYATKFKLVKDLGVKYTTDNSSGKKRRIIVECPKCNFEFEVTYQNIKNSNTTQCRSCASKESSITHGKTNHVLYKKYNNMINRCFDRKNPGYKNYGKRGITVCEEWRNDFKAFYDWSIANGYKEGLSIDRIDNDGNYKPSNCRWEDKFTQAQNTRVLRSTNTSGYRGVHYCKASNKWIAAISKQKTKIFLGRYVDKLDAAKAYDTYIVENNLEHNNNGVI